MSRPTTLTEVEEAIHWWFADDGQNVDSSVRVLLAFHFRVMGALHAELKRVPASWDEERELGLSSSGKYGTYLALPSMAEYAILRAILALVQDVHEIARAVKKLVPVGPLNSHASRIEAASAPFEGARHFFTHLNERLVDRGTHGITGAAQTQCGITYQAGAIGNLHLVLSKGAIHFTEKGTARVKGVMPRDFARLYEAGNLLFQMLAGHKTHARDYSQPLMLVPTPITTSRTEEASPQGH